MKKTTTSNWDDAIRQAEATNKVENLHLTSEGKALIKQVLTGQINEYAFVKEARRLAKELAARNK